MKKLLSILFLCFAFISNAQTVSITSSATGAICAGTSVTFTATPSGYTTPSYQWYKNNVPISGEINSTYSSSTLSNNDVIKVAVVEGSSSVTTNGLVMNLDAGNASSYSGTGNRWTDLTGRENNGTIPSAIVYNSANGGYFQFANSIGIVLPSASTDFNLGTSDFTIELWVNPNANGHRLLSINGRESTNSAAFQIISGPNGYLYTNYGTVSSGFTWGAWHHVVISRISTTCSTYVDGVLKGTTTDASSIGSNIVGSDAKSTTSNTLGSFYATSSYLSYQGKMSIARVYKDVGLTSSQVISNFNAICSRYGLSAIGSTSNSITSTVTPGPIAPSITVGGDGCVNKTTLSTPTGLSSYTWLKDNVAIPGATTTTYSPTESGNYKVAVSNGTCSTASAATTIYTCGVTADGKMISTTFSAPLVSSEGGANFGTTMDEVGKILNTTGLTTTTGTIAATTAVLGGIISATNAVTSSIGVIYSTDANFGTYSSSTIQSNVAAGTYTTTITGLTSETTYYSKSFIVNKAGTSYGPVVSFTTPVRPIAIGDSYGGGIVVYVLNVNDPGYDATISHGLIAAKVDLGKWAWNNGSGANTTNNYFGAGIGNTATIVAQSGTNGGTNYAAKVCDDYTVTETVGGITTTYNDWYLGSTFELQKMMQNSSYLTGSNSLTSNYYWASNEQTANGPATSGIAVGSALYVRPDSYIDQWSKTGAGTINVRAIRSF